MVRLMSGRIARARRRQIQHRNSLLYNTNFDLIDDSQEFSPVIKLDEARKKLRDKVFSTKTLPVREKRQLIAERQRGIKLQILD